MVYHSSSEYRSLIAYWHCRGTCLVNIARYTVVLPELHADLFSRHASSLEFCVLWPSTKEVYVYVMSDEICRRCSGKQRRRRRGGWSAQLPDWIMNKIKRQHIIIALTWVTKMRSFSSEKTLKVIQKAGLLFLWGSFVFVGLYLLGKEWGRDEGRCRQKRRRELPRVVRGRSSNIVLWYDTWYVVTYQILCGGRGIEGRGSVGRAGWREVPDGWVSYFNKRVFLI